MRRSHSLGFLWIVTAVIVLLLLIPFPRDESGFRWTALMHTLEDFAHPIVMAGLASLWLRRMQAARPRNIWRACMIVWVGMAAFGAVTEAAQQLTGRDSSWEDLINDVLGASLALLWHARRESLDNGRAVSRLHVPALVLIALACIAPLGWTVTAYVGRWAMAPLLWRDGAIASSRFSRWRDGKYPGLYIDEPLQDWRDFKTLHISLLNPTQQPSPIVVRIHDQRHDGMYADRFNAEFVLPPASSRLLTISLDAVRSAPADRLMDMGNIRGLIVFQREKPPRTFRVIEIRLDR